MATDGPRPIVLTTDFGLSDPYVGVMRGVILTINPTATIIDLTHQISPQNVRQAAFVLGASHRFFPPQSIHVAVVDPGVGTQRKALVLTTPGATFLAPDNGLLSGVLAGYVPEPFPASGPIPVPPACAALELSNPRYRLHPVSSTFHGRDIFSPAAAYLSLGVPPTEMGEPLNELLWRPPPVPSRHGSWLQGEIIYADHFGNLITNVPASLLYDPSEVEVLIKTHRISGLSPAFHQVESPPWENLIALIGSNGYVEIAVPDGSAARLLDASPGEPVWVRPGPSVSDG